MIKLYQSLVDLFVAGERIVMTPTCHGPSSLTLWDPKKKCQQTDQAQGGLFRFRFSFPVSEGRQGTPILLPPVQFSRSTCQNVSFTFATP
jgi:hypothetical protein